MVKIAKISKEYKIEYEKISKQLKTFEEQSYNVIENKEE